MDSPTRITIQVATYLRIRPNDQQNAAIRDVINKLTAPQR
jgi:hypothetical protein